MIKANICVAKSNPSVGGWVDVITFVDVSLQTTWLITVASPDGTNAEAHTFRQQAAECFDTTSHKSAQTLYAFLSQEFADQPEVSVAALCLQNTQLTLFARGNTEIGVNRQQKYISLISAPPNGEWASLTGAARIEDRWYVQAGLVGSVIHTIAAITETNQQLNEFQALIDEAELPSAAAVTTLVEWEPPLIEANPISTDEEYKQKKRRQVMALGWIVLLILIVSILFGSKTRTEKQLQAGYQNLNQQAQTSIQTANQLKDTDPAKAREIMKTLQTEITNAQPLFAKHDTWAKKWTSLREQVDSAAQSIAGQATLTDLPIWFTLGVVKPGFIGNRLAAASDSLLVLDTSSNTLIKVGTASKRADILAGGESLAGARYITASPTRAIVLTSKGVIDISLTRKTTSTLIEPDSEWQQPVGIGLFNGNVYLADAGAATVWRYPGLTQGVGAKQAWLGNGVSLSSGPYTDLAIDGDLWLLKESGNLVRFRRGAPLSFTITGLDTPLGSLTPAFAVGQDADIVAIVDAANQRLVVTTKQGKYQKQIQWPGFSNVEDIALSVDATTVYILRLGNIYSTSL